MPNEADEQPVHIIPAESVDQRRLIRLLRETYGESQGKDNFRVELRLNRYKIYQTDKSSKRRELTQDQIRDLKVQRER